MQKLIKLSDTHYIVVDDSKIKEGDWVCNIQKPYIKQCQDIDVDYYNKRNDVFKKITHSTEPLEYKYGSQKHGFNMGVMSSDIKLVYDQIKPLDLSEVEEAINGYSVEKMADEWSIDTNNVHPADSYIAKSGYEAGFKAHQELTKDKLFTIEDMQKAMDFMYWFCQDVTNEYLEHNFNIKNAGDLNTNQAINTYIQSLLPKTEWDIEIDEQGKIKLTK